MEIVNIIISIAVPIIIFYLGVLDRKLNNMQLKIDKAVTRDDADRIIELEIKTVTNEQTNLKEDINRVERKVDKILDKLTIIK